MDQTVPDSRSCYYDLTLFGVNVVVDDVVTELYGVVESETENSVDKDVELIEYLTQTNDDVHPQLMARMKQTGRKTDKDGKLATTTTSSTKSTETPALQSPGGQSLATFPRRSQRFLDSNSEIEWAAAMFGVGSPPARSTRSQTPSRGTSPTRSSPRRGTPRRGTSPARGSPARGSPGRGCSPARRSPRKSPGRGTPVDRDPRPVGMVTPQVKPSTSGIPARRPGQPGFVNRGGGSGRGSSRNLPGRFNLPSFSTEEEDDDNDDDDDEDDDMDYDPDNNEGNGDNDDNNEDDDDETEEEMEVDFPNQGRQQPPPPRRPIAVKNMNLIRAPKRGKSGFAEIARWNRTARQGAFNEMKRGWMKKRQRDPRNQNELRRRRPGFQVLCEIRFYQKLTCFLISMRVFQRFAR